MEVGREHSNFTFKAKNKYGNLWLYEDEQKLNPQYVLTDKIKDLFKIKKGQTRINLQIILQRRI